VSREFASESQRDMTSWMRLIQQVIDRANKIAGTGDRAGGHGHGGGEGTQRSTDHTTSPSPLPPSTPSSSPRPPPAPTPAHPSSSSSAVVAGGFSSLGAWLDAMDLRCYEVQ